MQVPHKPALRDLPVELGLFQSAHKRLIRWAVNGTWHTFSRMRNYRILRDSQQRGNGLHNAVPPVARMHNLILTA